MLNKSQQSLEELKNRPFSVGQPVFCNRNYEYVYLVIERIWPNHNDYKIRARNGSVHRVTALIMEPMLIDRVTFRQLMFRHNLGRNSFTSARFS